MVQTGLNTQETLYRIVTELITTIRRDPKSVLASLQTLQDKPEYWSDVLTNGAIADAQTQNFPAYQPFTETALETLKQAMMLAEVEHSAQNQLTKDYIAGEWVGFTLNAQAWSDMILLINMMASGKMRSGWGSGFGSKMAAIWNMIEAEQELTDARRRNYWLRAVSFGDAVAIMDANNGTYPSDIPRNGALKAEISQQMVRLANCQKKYDLARRQIDTAMKDVISITNFDQLSA